MYYVLLFAILALTAAVCGAMVYTVRHHPWRLVRIIAWIVAMITTVVFLVFAGITVGAFLS